MNRITGYLVNKNWTKYCVNFGLRSELKMVSIIGLAAWKIFVILSTEYYITKAMNLI